MSRHLALYDISAYVHTGMNSPTYEGYTFQRFPLGGVKFFLKYFVLSLMKHPDVAVAFDSRSFRKNLYGSYKGDRTSNHAVSMQLEFLYRELLDADIPAYKVDGFEADDIIFTGVQQNKKNYLKVSIFSSDYDLTHNVDHNVVFMAVNSNVNNVSVSNFKESVVRGRSIRLNTISAHKVFCGCDSDGIAPFSCESGESPWELYQGFVNFINEKFPNISIEATTRKDVLGVYLNTIAHKFTDKEKQDLKVRLEVVFPKLVPDLKVEGRGREGIRMDRLQWLLSVVNDYQSLKLLGLKKAYISDADIEGFRRMARELETGEFAVDRNLPVRDKVVDSQVIYLREFS